MTASGYDRAVWSWTEHLRHGGSSPWSEWDAIRAGTEQPPTGWSASGAAQLELVRRLAARGSVTGPRGPAFTALADLVLTRAGPGRGLAQQPLSWSPDDGTGRATRVGAPPVDPVDVPVEELVRLGVGALTELVLTDPEPTSALASMPRFPFTRTPAFRLDGAPVTAAAVRRDLGAAGHAEGGRSPVVVLLAEPIDVALAQVWSARVQQGAAVRWQGVVDRWAARDTLPPPVDLASLAGSWAGRVGPDRVHVVVAPGDAERAARLTAELVGVDLSSGRRGVFGVLREAFLVPAPSDLPPASVEVARRVNALLGVRAEGERREDARRSLLAVLPAGPRQRPLTLPERHHDWARARGERLVEELLAGRYPVRGRLEDLVPSIGEGTTRPRTAVVLRALLRACLHRAQANDQPRTEAK